MVTIIVAVFLSPNGTYRQKVNIASACLDYYPATHENSHPTTRGRMSFYSLLVYLFIYLLFITEKQYCQGVAHTCHNHDFLPFFFLFPSSCPLLVASSPSISSFILSLRFPSRTSLSRVCPASSSFTFFLVRSIATTAFLFVPVSFFMGSLSSSSRFIPFPSLFPFPPLRSLPFPFSHTPFSIHSFTLSPFSMPSLTLPLFPSPSFSIPFLAPPHSATPSLTLNFSHPRLEAFSPIGDALGILGTRLG